MLISILKLFLAAAILPVAFYVRSPLLASVRFELLGAIAVLGLGLIFSEILGLREKKPNQKAALSKAVVTVASLGLIVAVAGEINFALAKQSVLNADPYRLEKLGRHLVAGYSNFDEIKQLVSKKAVGGVFVTAKNVSNKSPEEIQQEIKALQDIRRSQGLPPLWVATDQEGGIVSRLSPPLSQLPPLSKIVEGETQVERKKKEVIQYARQQGRELAELGVNLNFAPVVDLNKGIVNPSDKFSQIYRRAISADKDVVAKVALWYCQTLEESGVRCTIKHFPGLGRVETDTHIDSAELRTPVEELMREDWVPFREVMSNSQALTMLGHAKLTAVDAKRPVSFSKPAVTGIIRNNWKQDGILITDDFSMHAVYGSEDGLEKAAVQAVNAGVDLILISYDKDLYYKALRALLKAEEQGGLDGEMLEKSGKRLEKKSLRWEN
ncbi:MAG: glycoside hydrolase family 3 protein [Oscillatoria princeps RMCB-10]|nr:glycoside hydrolase family 3 protein [Oscillatoria princeps RMCB-10]